MGRCERMTIPHKEVCVCCRQGRLKQRQLLQAGSLQRPWMNGGFVSLRRYYTLNCTGEGCAHACTRTLGPTSACRLAATARAPRMVRDVMTTSSPALHMPKPCHHEGTLEVLAVLAFVMHQTAFATSCIYTKTSF